MKQFFSLKSVLFLVTASLFVSCGNQKSTTKIDASKLVTNVYPHSDKENKGNWKLRTDISDEFEADKIDEDKWYIVGKFKNGKPFYKHPDFPNKKVWKGRQPSQFSGRNYRLEDGKLILETRWEPDFPFSDELSKPWGPNKDIRNKFENITTACFIGRKFFKYGYMEIKSKAADAEITSAFWAIGGKTELDIFEQFGDHRQPNKEARGKDRELWWSIHDWTKDGKGKTTYTEHHDLGFRVADDFHIYGAEWGEDFLKLFIDGKQIHHFTQDDVGLDWVLNNPMEVWLDSEIFKWLGVPHKEELPVDFEIDYMRVWQKPSDNLLAKDRAFYGFEGPILYEENPRPLKMVPEDSTPNNYQKFWIFDEGSSKYLKIIEGHYHSGVESLQFSGYGKNDSLQVEKTVIKSPEGALNLPKGDYKLSAKVWLDQGRVADAIHVSLMNPKIDLQFNGLKKMPRRE